MSNFDLGLMVKNHCKKAGLIQIELANLAGIVKTTVFDTEKNKETVGWSILRAVLGVLNITVEFRSPLNKNV